MEITGYTGNMLLSTLNIGGDANINNIEGMMTLIDSNLNLEVLSISLVSQDVTVQNNTNLSLTVEEVDGAVLITDNTITVANVNKNTGGVEINNINITIHSRAETVLQCLLVVATTLILPMANVQLCKRITFMLNLGTLNTVTLCS